MLTFRETKIKMRRRKTRRVRPENLTEEIRKKDKKITRILYWFLLGTILTGCAV
tara:strand:+ start:445 stop:606 length:162 start_codon:yes stop_codon:yes gene_type:complete